MNFQGFIILPSFLKSRELDPVLEAIDHEVDLIAERLYKAGKIKGMKSRTITSFISSMDRRKKLCNWALENLL